MDAQKMWNCDGKERRANYPAESPSEELFAEVVNGSVPCSEAKPEEPTNDLLYRPGRKRNGKGSI